MSNLLGGSVRAMRSIFPTSSNDEKINFARFKNENCPTDTTELTNFHANGAVSKGMPGDDKDSDKCENGTPFPTYIEDDVGSEDQNERNQISEWQAGWNVTNAIQVSVRAQMYTSSVFFS